MESDKEPPKRRKREPSPVPTVDQLPPHSIEAEQGVLGCILTDPDACMDSVEGRFKRNALAFYDIKHQEIFTAMVHLWHKEKYFDLITLRQHLKDAGKLEEVGLPYLMELPDKGPSAANLSYYLDIVDEKYQLRRIIQTCGEVIQRVQNYQGDIGELKYIVQSDLGEVFSQDEKPIGDSATWNELLEFDTENDANCVIGVKNGKTTRYLCKGHGAWLIGPSGVGKSSLAMLFAVAFAAGRPVWGVAPVKPLRVLVVQAENDIGDLAEMAKGIEQGLDVAFGDEAELIANNIKVVTVTGKIGQDFCHWLRKQIIDHKADLVLADPLLSFAGIDVSRQDQTSQFLRIWLDPALRETGAVLLSVHHTGKPPRGEKGKGEPTLFEMAYAGIGSSELVNWARAIILLQPAGEGNFRLIMAKRGKRAWATHPNGEFTQTLWLRHATTGIFWEQVEPPEESEPARKGGKDGRPDDKQRVATMNLHSFCSDCKPEGEGLNSISKRLEVWLAKQSEDLSLRTCQRIIPMLVKNGKLAKGEDGLYRKGTNA